MAKGRKKGGGSKPPQDEQSTGDAFEVEVDADAALDLADLARAAAQGEDAEEGDMDVESNAIINMLYSGMTAADLMTREVITVRAEARVDEISELFQIHNINGAPVVDDEGMLIGIVTEDDVVVGGMGLSDEELDLYGNEGEGDKEAPDMDAEQNATEAGKAQDEGAIPERQGRLVGEIMTPQPIAMEEDTPVEELCRLMWQLKIHRIPIVREGRVRGIVSTIDLCRLVVEGRARIVPMD